MKISSANKKQTAVPKNTTETIFEKSVDAAPNPIDLVDVEILSADSANLSSGRVDFTFSTMNEKLIATGYENIELVIDEKPEEKLPPTATAAQINAFFTKETTQQKPIPEKKLTIDLKQSVGNDALTGIAIDGVNRIEDDETIVLEFVKSTNPRFDTQKIPSSVIPSVTEQSDNTGTLEIRLGKNNETFADKKVDELSALELDLSLGEITDTPLFSNQGFNVSRAVPTQGLEVPDKSPLISMLEAPTTNKGNKRIPNLSRTADIKNSGLRMQQKLQRPLIKSIKRVKKQRIITERRTLDLPGPTSNISVKLTNRETGEIIKKPLRQRRLQTIPYKKVYPYKQDINLPKIDVSPVGGSQAIVSLSNIDPCFNKITIFRREISQRNFEDVYEEINQIKDPAESLSFIDNLENARAFKYVCVADNLPIYSFTTFKSKGFKYENVQEPFAFAFQNNQNVIINVSRLPSFCRKLFVFRKSSAEDEEQLVDSIGLFGKGTESVRLVDNPSPIEQVIEYRFVWIDENGIENQFEERPKVVYTAKLGQESANIIRFNAIYDNQTNEVNISGEAIAENLFIADNDAELSNPSERTLKAAARDQNIIKVQLRRINLKTEEDEIILKEIINPGISKFDSELLAQNRLTFKFSDSGENSATFGYTPLMDNTDYTYIARIIVYPLGLELRKVSNFTTIEGIRAPGRLKYTFDPGVFNHPLNTELGILPGNVGAKSYMVADIVGQTTKAISRNVRVFESDIEDSINLQAQIKIDSALDPVVRLSGTIPNGLLNDIDHLQIEMSYDTIKQTDIIDRLFLLKSNFEYFDYAFDDLACNEVGYRLIGIGKDFTQIFKSEPVFVSLKDKKLQVATDRRNSLKNYREKKSAEESKAKRSRRTAKAFSKRGITNG